MATTRPSPSRHGSDSPGGPACAEATGTTSLLQGSSESSAGTAFAETADPACPSQGSVAVGFAAATDPRLTQPAAPVNGEDSALPSSTTVEQHPTSLEKQKTFEDSGLPSPSEQAPATRVKQEPTEDSGLPSPSEQAPATRVKQEPTEELVSAVPPAAVLTVSNAGETILNGDYTIRHDRRLADGLLEFEQIGGESILWQFNGNWYLGHHEVGEICYKAEAHRSMIDGLPPEDCWEDCAAGWPPNPTITYKDTDCMITGEVVRRRRLNKKQSERTTKEPVDQAASLVAVHTLEGIDHDELYQTETDAIFACRANSSITGYFGWQDKYWTVVAGTKSEIEGVRDAHTLRAKMAMEAKHMLIGHWYERRELRLTIREQNGELYYSDDTSNDDSGILAQGTEWFEITIRLGRVRLKLYDRTGKVMWLLFQRFGEEAWSNCLLYKAELADSKPDMRTQVAENVTKITKDDAKEPNVNTNPNADTEWNAEHVMNHEVKIKTEVTVEAKRKAKDDVNNDTVVELPPEVKKQKKKQIWSVAREYGAALRQTGGEFDNAEFNKWLKKFKVDITGVSNKEIENLLFLTVDLTLDIKKEEDVSEDGGYEESEFSYEEISSDEEVKKEFYGGFHSDDGVQGADYEEIELPIATQEGVADLPRRRCTAIRTPQGSYTATKAQQRNMEYKGDTSHIPQGAPNPRSIKRRKYGSGENLQKAKAEAPEEVKLVAKEEVKEEPKLEVKDEKGTWNDTASGVGELVKDETKMEVKEEEGTCGSAAVGVGVLKVKEESKMEVKEEEDAWDDTAGGVGNLNVKDETKMEVKEEEGTCCNAAVGVGELEVKDETKQEVKEEDGTGNNAAAGVGELVADFQEREMGEEEEDVCDDVDPALDELGVELQKNDRVKIVGMRPKYKRLEGKRATLYQLVENRWVVTMDWTAHRMSVKGRHLRKLDPSVDFEETEVKTESEDEDLTSVAEMAAREPDEPCRQGSDVRGYIQRGYKVIGYQIDGKVYKACIIDKRKFLDDPENKGFNYKLDYFKGRRGTDWVGLCNFETKWREDKIFFDRHGNRTTYWKFAGYGYKWGIADGSYSGRVRLWISQCVEFQKNKRTWCPTRPCCLPNLFIQPREPPTRELLLPCFFRLDKEEKRRFRALVDSSEAECLYGTHKDAMQIRRWHRLLHPERPLFSVCKQPEQPHNLESEGITVEVRLDAEDLKDFENGASEKIEEAARQSGVGAETGPSSIEFILSTGEKLKAGSAFHERFPEGLANFPDEFLPLIMKMTFPEAFERFFLGDTWVLTSNGPFQKPHDDEHTDGDMLQGSQIFESYGSNGPERKQDGENTNRPSKPRAAPLPRNEDIPPLRLRRKAPSTIWVEPQKAKKARVAELVAAAKPAPVFNATWKIEALQNHANDNFHQGDIGIGVLRDDRMTITWTNGQVHSTKWPNEEWFNGFVTEASFIPEDWEIQALQDHENEKFHVGDKGTGVLRGEHMTITWSNGNETFTSWPNPDFYTGIKAPSASDAAFSAELNRIGSCPQGQFVKEHEEQNKRALVVSKKQSGEPGVSWHAGTAAWRVSFQENGVQRKIVVGVREYMKEGLSAMEAERKALYAAIALRKSVISSGTAKAAQKDGTKLKSRGVTWEPRRQGWRAQLKVGKRNHNGPYRHPRDATSEEVEKARLLAVNDRRELERKYFAVQTS